MQLDRVRLPRIIECRTALHPVADVSVNRLRNANDLPEALLGLPARLAPDRHEVDYFAHTVIAVEARYQDIGVGQVHLLDRALALRRKPVVAALLFVQDRSENAGGIETGKAAPVDRTILARQTNRMQITDHTVICNRLVARPHNCDSTRRDAKAQ